MINLNNLLDNLKRQITTKLPDHITKAFEESTNDLRIQKTGSSAPKTGDTLPSFKLLNTKGELIDSDQLLQDNDKLIVAFFRGGWCPYCNLELKVLQDVLPLIKAKKAALVAISPQKVEKNAAMPSENPFGFDILSDMGNQYAKQLHIAFNLQDFVSPYYQQLGIDLSEYNGSDDNSLPVPAVFVIDKNKTVTFTFIDVDYTRRVEIDQLINQL